MARVKMPLMSGEASGKFGGALVFGQRKGSAVVRKLVTPANPKSQGQEDARNIVRVAGALQRFVRVCVAKRSGETLTDQQLLTGSAPANNTWNGYLVQVITGKFAATYTAAVAAYGALTAPQKTAWNDAALALTPPIPTVGQTEEGGGAVTSLSAGQVFFTHIYGLSSVGLADVPGAVPPTYA
jgi:hypothetical protein